MGYILQPSQCEKIKKLNKEFLPYAERGWMCEGSDLYGLCNVIFNNDTEESFWADYDGNILDSEITSEPMENVLKMAKIQGEIRKVIS